MTPTPTQVYDALKYRIEIGRNGSKRYYNANGRLHRMEGPAVEWEGGSRWYQNGKLHRTDGPAVVYANGTRYWWQNDLLHRTDGPAVITAEIKRWYINGKILTEAEFKEAVKHND